MSDPTSTIYLVFKAAKAAGVAAGAGVGLLIAQVEIGDLPANLGLVGLLAVLVARYTFRQLEDYRNDLKAARARGDHLEDELELAATRERQLEAKVRELEEYAHRLRLFTLSAGADPTELPHPPTPNP